SPLAGGSDWQWYLQGEVLAGQSGSSLTLGTADLLGDYNLGVSVVYQGVLYSGDAVIRVSEGDLPTYTVWYDAAGGTAAPAESEHAPGDTVSLGAEPSRAGYDFLGWQSDDIPPGSEPGGLHQPGGTFTMPGKHVLFRASWEPELLPVENLQGSANNTTHTLDLTWTDPVSPALEGIQVSWGLSGGPEEGELFSVAPGAGTARIMNVDPGMYLVEVRAVYAGGGVSDSRTVEIERVDYEDYSVGGRGPAGGVIFYEHPDPANAGWRFLEAAPRGWYGPVEDPRYEWIGGGEYQSIPGAVSGAIGRGLENSRAIDEGQTAQQPNAARVCLALHITRHERLYDDWFLPSRDELAAMMMYNTSDPPAGESLELDEIAYWSSTQNLLEPDKAWLRNRQNNENSAHKGLKYTVRPVRRF
ncbi:InlB B-repeat-containing protein, partial [Alkalispirochaeta sphaeroplastigenens]|uniref:InlB B-repeat-containing protein n=1 Tax=Alkalispirochaeta sphaeroplastigenens TaxID=1187066 RepID=UPI0011AF3DF5